MEKTALVTGASRGIGKAIALRLAKDGYNVAVNYNKNDSLALQTVNEIKNLGVEAEAFKADTSNIDEVKNMFRNVQSTFGRLDVLVNNAGVVDDAYLLMVRQDSLERSLDIMLMYGKEASNRKQEIDRQHYTIPNQRPKDKHCGKI